MLTKPRYGWTDFSLEGVPTYELSYLDDIAFDWIEQAIHGLETLLPFCVKGFLEPYRMLCTVSYWNCHIVVENDEREPLKKEYTVNAYSHTSMLSFCKHLYNDISMHGAALINGPAYYEKAKNGKQKDLWSMELEALLYVPQRAWAHKHRQPEEVYPHTPLVSFETGGKTEGWK